MRDILGQKDAQITLDAIPPQPALPAPLRHLVFSVFPTIPHRKR
jgi:hypothetical protein